MQSLTFSIRAAQAIAHPISRSRDTVSAPSFARATPRLLAGLGVVANALFWGGLLVPYHGAASAETAFLHAFVAALGGALAVGGATAVMLMVARQVAVRLGSTQMVAAVLHFSVLIACAALSFNAFVRG